jgi:hypothetical protein
MLDCFDYTRKPFEMVAGYSGTPLVKKLGIREGMILALLDAPDGYPDLLGPLPKGVELKEGPSTDADADIVHLFTNSRDRLFEGLAHARKMVQQNGAIWVSWFKKAAKLPTEITEDIVREAALPLGLVDVKVCAVDEKWSGLKLVIRRENRI